MKNLLLGKNWQEELGIKRAEKKQQLYKQQLSYKQACVEWRW